MAVSAIDKFLFDLTLRVAQYPIRSVPFHFVLSKLFAPGMQYT